jgi:hypothetical protein
MLAEPLIFLQDLYRVIRDVVLDDVRGVVGPWFRAVLGTELRDPAVGELGDGRSVLIFECLQLPKSINHQQISCLVEYRADTVGMRAPAAG